MNSKFLTVRIIHLGLCLGLLLSLAVFYFVRSSDPSAAPQPVPLFFMIAAAMAAAAAGAAFFLPGVMLARHQMAKHDAGIEPLSEEEFIYLLLMYQTAKIVQWALLEGAGLIGAVFFFLTGDSQFLVISLTMAALLVFFRPSLSDFTKRLAIPAHRLPPAS